MADNKPTTVNPLTRLAVSMKLIKTATPARIPIATAIAVKVFAILDASGPTAFTAATRVAIINPKAEITTTPLTISAAERYPISFITPTISPIDTETDNNNPLILATLCQILVLVIDTRAFINTRNAAANAAPLSISLTDNMPANLTTPTISAIDVEIDNSKKLSLAIFESLSTLAAFRNTNTNAAKAPAKTAPLVISVGDNRPTSFTTPTISPIAIDILIIIPPSLLILSPAKRDIPDSRATNAVKAVTNTAPLAISAPDNNPMALTATAVSSNAVAIFFIIFPALSICFAESPFTNVPNAHKIVPIATTIPANPANPWTAFSRFIDPSNLTLAAISNTAVPIPTRPLLSPDRLSFLFALSIDTDDEVSLSIAIANAASTPAIIATATPPFIKAFLSNVPKAYIAAAMIPMAIANSLSADALVFNALAFRVLEKLFRTFWMFSLDSEINLLTEESTFPAPSNGPANLSIISVIFFTL